MTFLKITKLHIIVVVLVLIPYLGMILVYKWYNNKLDKIENAHFILVSKQEMQLSVFDYKGNEIFKFPIACGLNYGDKKERGDSKTPEGVFRVMEIQQSDKWTHDFKDGNGLIEGAYGPYFISLYVTGFSGIGIHGTHNPNSIKKRVTEGCIRLRNEDLLKIAPLVHHGTVVIITASVADIKISGD